MTFDCQFEFHSDLVLRSKSGYNHIEGLLTSKQYLNCCCCCCDCRRRITHFCISWSSCRYRWACTWFLLLIWFWIWIWPCLWMCYRRNLHVTLQFNLNLNLAGGKSLIFESWSGGCWCHICNGIFLLLLPLLTSDYEYSGSGFVKFRIFWIWMWIWTWTWTWTWNWTWI